MKFITVFIFVIFLFQANLSAREFDKIKYRTHLGECPARIGGNLSLKIQREFETKRTLSSIKKLIIKDKIKEKYFLSDYKIEYNPIKKNLSMSYDCPKPLMRVHLYKNFNDEADNSILVSNGQLFDPTYEVILRSDGKLNHDLPLLSLTMENMNKIDHKFITEIMLKFSQDFTRKFSEVILDQRSDLTIIMSINSRPVSVFFGNNNWIEKVDKLKRTVRYLEMKGKIPKIINLTNSKKVVVKFT